MRLLYHILLKRAKFYKKGSLQNEPFFCLRMSFSRLLRLADVIDDEGLPAGVVVYVAGDGVRLCTGEL